MRRRLIHLLPVSLCALVACGGDEGKPAAPRPAAPPAKADETVALTLGEENRSGISGTATLKGGERGFTVVLVMKRPKDVGPAHIHNVTCEKYRALEGFDAQLATVEEALRDVLAGKSKTRVDKALSRYRTAGFSINVHSYVGTFPVVACADIPRG